MAPIYRVHRAVIFAVAQLSCKSTVFLPVMIPIDLRPSQCPTQARYGSACKILPPYVTPF